MTTCENYGVYSHQQIRHEMYDGAGPSSQADAMAGWHQLAGRLSAIREYVDAAVSGVRAAQQGAAADVAVGAMVPLGAWVDEAQRLADDTRDRIDHQISGFTTARDSIPEVPPEPRGWSWQEIAVIDGFTTSDQEADEAFNAEQERHARAVMMAYQNGTNERVGSVARFAPPPTGEPDVSILAGNRSEIGGFPGGAGGVAPGSPTLSAGVGAGAPGELSVVAPVPTGSSPGGPGPEYGGGRPTPTAPGGPVLSGVVPGTPAAGGPRIPGSGRGGPGAARTRSGPGGAGTRGVSGGGARTQGGPGGVRGPAVGGFGASSGRGPGVGGFGPERSAGGFGPIGSPESAAARAASGSPVGAGRGGASAGGMAPFGAMGGGQGREDQERQRPSYLIEPDSNRLIGELPPTAPAVIGEDPPDYGGPSRR